MTGGLAHIGSASGQISARSARLRQLLEHLRGLNLAVRTLPEILRCLRNMPARRGFDVELDLEVVEGYARGQRTDVLALDLGMDGAQIMARFRELTASIRDDHGHITIEGQARLLTVLRYLVREARAA